MYYISTRGQAIEQDFPSASLAGLAGDGGLYVPKAYPSIAPPKSGESYTETATRILSAFAGEALDSSIIAEDVEAAYAPFGHADVTPLKALASDVFLLELHHGPTLAFKDVAMRYLARLYDRSLRQNGQRMIVLCATSGDTGGAAAAAFAGLSSVQVCILHPHERVAPRQRLFMTTSGADNIHNLALQGDFDTCQAIVKSLFADESLKGCLSGVNSINWVRIAAQSVYYARVQAAFGAGQALRFVVPTGNFGDGLAAWVAHRCGLLNSLECVLAVNSNDTMVRLLRGEALQRGETVATPSPAMDIQLPSNFERLLYTACGDDAQHVRAVYEGLARTGAAPLPQIAIENMAQSGFRADSISDAQTLQKMAQTWQTHQELVCPHTAVGLAAADRAGPSDKPVIVLATAHAAKFPETVREATGQAAPLPDRCADLEAHKEAFQTMPASLEAVRAYIQAMA